MYIDSHCHLDRIDLKDFNNDFNQLLETIRQARVERLLCVSINLEDYPAMKDLVKDQQNIDISVGTHPCDARDDTVKLHKLD